MLPTVLTEPPAGGAARTPLEQRVLRAGRLSALLASALSGYATLVLLTPPGPRRVAGCLALVAFTLAFLRSTRSVGGGPQARATLGYLAVQLAATTLLPDLLMPLAFAVSLTLAGPALARWALLQALATVAILVAQAPNIYVAAPDSGHHGFYVAVLLHVLTYLAWQALVGTAGWLTAAALRARRDLDGRLAAVAASRTLLDREARAAERTRVLQGLDELLGRRLGSLGGELAAVQARAAPGPGREALVPAVALVERMRREVRQVDTGENMAALDLRSALQTLLARVPGLDVDLDQPAELQVSPSVAHVVFRCVQEALTNALRHAHARRLRVELRTVPGALLLHAGDDGRGCAVLREGTGLAGMRARVEELEGELHVESGPGAGFQVSVRLPHEPGWHNAAAAVETGR